MVDQHIVNSSKGDSNNVDLSLIFNMLALNFVPDPPQEMVPFTPKIIIFDDKKPRRFFFQSQPVTNGKQFILNVQSQTGVKIGISIDEAKPRIY